MADAAITDSIQKSRKSIEGSTSRTFSWSAFAKSLILIAVLTLFLPVNLLVTATAWLVSWLRIFSKARVNRSGQTVMLSGGKMTKALQLARLFHRSGYRVVLCETAPYRLTAHRFSSCVDKFETIPEPDSSQYAERLCEIAVQEQVDFYVPVCSPVSSYYDAQAKPRLEQHCRVIHVDPNQIQTVDNKFLFAQSARELDLAVPATFRITNAQQVIDFDFGPYQRPFILKSLAYDPVRRLDMTKFPLDSLSATKRHLSQLPISDENPWILQEFIEGQEFCTHSTVIEGEIRVHVCCESSAFQVNYDPVEQPEIFEWIKTYCKGHSLTGQLSFDFIRSSDDGKIYAIECNPRTHSAITSFYANRDVAEAYFEKSSTKDAVTPEKYSRPTYWLAHEVHRVFKSFVRLDLKSFVKRLSIVLNGKEAVFDWRDPLPFFMLHHVHVPYLLMQTGLCGKDWLKVDFNIGKLVRAGGD